MVIDFRFLELHLHEKKQDRDRPGVTVPIGLIQFTPGLPSNNLSSQIPGEYFFSTWLASPLTFYCEFYKTSVFCYSCLPCKRSKNMRYYYQ